MRLESRLMSVIVMVFLIIFGIRFLNIKLWDIIYCERKLMVFIEGLWKI